VASGVAETVTIDDDGKETNRRERTSGEELARLRRHYPTKSRNNTKVHVVDELFPGLNPTLPQTFQDIGLQVEVPRRAPSRAHGPELAEKTGEENVGKYDAAPKAATEPKSKKAATEPKSKKAAATEGDPK
jgi:hypothetical protein